MTTARRRNFRGTAAVLLTAMLALVAGCQISDQPAWDNPLDPDGVNYVMQFPVLGTPVVNAARQVTFPVYTVDPYAQLILLERRNGSTGTYGQVATMPASQQLLVDTVPATEGPVVWYRARLQSKGGSLSPFSSAVYIAMP
jgi:hypothetical protein